MMMIRLSAFAAELVAAADPVSYVRALWPNAIALITIISDFSIKSMRADGRARAWPCEMRFKPKMHVCLGEGYRIAYRTRDSHDLPDRHGPMNLRGD